MAPTTNAPLSEHIIDIENELDHAIRLCDEIRRRHPGSSGAVDSVNNTLHCGKTKLAALKQDAGTVTGEHVGTDHADNAFRTDMHHCAHSTRKLRTRIADYEKHHQSRAVPGFFGSHRVRGPPVHSTKLNEFNEEWHGIEKRMAKAFEEFKYRVEQSKAETENADAVALKAKTKAKEEVTKVQELCKTETEKEKARADNLKLELKKVSEERERKREKQVQRDEETRDALHKDRMRQITEGPAGMVTGMAETAKEIKKIHDALAQPQRDEIVDFERLGEVVGKLHNGCGPDQGEKTSDVVKTMGNAASKLVEAVGHLSHQSAAGSNIRVSLSGCGEPGCGNHYGNHDGCHCLEQEGGHWCHEKHGKLHACSVGAVATHPIIEEPMEDESSEGVSVRGHQIDFPNLGKRVALCHPRGTSCEACVDKVVFRDKAQGGGPGTCRHPGYNGKTPWIMTIDHSRYTIERLDGHDGVFFPFTKNLPR